MTIPESPLPDKSPDRVAGAKPLEDVTSKGAAGNFQSHMNPPGAGTIPGALSTQGTTAPTPISLQQGGANLGSPTMDSLTQQAKVAQDGLGIIEEQVNTAKSTNVKIKRSQSELLKTKLQDVRDYGKSVGDKLGLQTPALSQTPSGGAMEKFLAYIGDGQNQFAAVQKKLEEMSTSGEPINPADMLLIQSKMNIAQQEIEYSSTLLGKVMTSMTTVMNIQL